MSVAGWFSLACQLAAICLQIFLEKDCETLSFTQKKKPLWIRASAELATSFKLSLYGL